MAGLFLLQVKFEKTATVASQIKKCVGFLKSANARDIYKVAGENRLLAVIGKDVEAFLDKFNSSAEIKGETEAIPIRPYKDFAKNQLGVDDSLLDYKYKDLPREGVETFLLDFTIEYKGHTTKELMDIWKREAEFVLKAIKAGQMNMNVYKTVVKRGVFGFTTVPDGGALDDALLGLPMIQENGFNSFVTVKSLIPV